MAAELNQVDLAFVIDTTGSMGAFINTARGHMIAMLRELASASAIPIDLQVGLVEYRDHPPQDSTFVTRPYDLTADLEEVQKVIDALKPMGGGDGPEAVYDGLLTACQRLSWRPHSLRLAILIGDAPAHGAFPRGDGFPQGCPCGETAESITALFENHLITLYALGLTHFVAENFGQLARYTGGEYFPAEQGEASIQAIKKLLANEFGDLEFEQRIFDMCQVNPGWTLDEYCQGLQSTRGRVSAGLSRLGRRELV